MSSKAIRPKKKIVESATQGGERRTSKITSVGGKGDVLVLLGDEETNGWSMRINKASGDLTGTIAADGTGYLIFGSCLGGCRNRSGKKAKTENRWPTRHSRARTTSYAATLSFARRFGNGMSGVNLPFNG
jgi:hypothetical protein